MFNPKHQFEKEMTLQKQLKKSLLLFFRKKKLRKYAMLTILNTSLSTSVFRFEAAYFEQLLQIYWISIVRILQHALGCLSFHLAAMLDKRNLIKIIFYSAMGNSLVRLIGLIMNNTIAPFVVAMQNLFYGPAESSSITLLQQEYNNSLRATLDSMIGLFACIGTALMSFLIGLIADFYSIRGILIGCCVCGMGIAFSYHRLLKPIKVKK